MNTTTLPSPFESASPLGGKYQALLTASGIATQADLARNQPEKLLRWMEEVNDEQQLVRKLPALEVVRGWVHQAQALGVAA